MMKPTVPSRAIELMRTLLNRIHFKEAGVLIALLAVVLMTWGFIELADEVSEGSTHAFDRWVMRSLRHSADPSMPAGPQWLTGVARDVTALGSAAVLVLVVLAVAGYLWLENKRHAMWLVIGATITGNLVSNGLKWYFDRPRPDVVPHLIDVTTTSFPSGHAMLAAVVYLTLAALLMRLTPDRRTKLYVLCVALFLTFLVGISRIYLGVHYPTDVLAGWSAGLAWALLCWVLAIYLQKRGTIESEHADAAPHEPPLHAD